MSEWWKNFAAMFCLVVVFCCALAAAFIASFMAVEAFGPLPVLIVAVVIVAAVLGAVFASDQAKKPT